MNFTDLKGLEIVVGKEREKNGNLKKVHQELLSKFESVKKTCAPIELKHSESNAEFYLLKKKVLNLQHEKENLEARYRKILLDTETELKFINQVKEQKIDYANLINMLSKRCEQFHEIAYSDVPRPHENYQNLKNQISRLRVDVNDVTARVEKMENEIQHKKYKIDSLRNILQSQQYKQNQVQKDIDGHKQEATKKYQQVQQLKERYSTLQSQLEYF